MFSKKSTDMYWGKPLKAQLYEYYKKNGYGGQKIKLENIKDEIVNITLYHIGLSTIKIKNIKINKKVFLNNIFLIKVPVQMEVSYSGISK